jgi:hypothetical protein
MDPEQLTLAISSLQGEMRGIRELFSMHTDQDATQFTALNNSMEEIDDKLDRLLLREAERKGEINGIRRSATILATTIPLAITVGGLILGIYV